MVSTLTQFLLLDVVALKHDLPEHNLTAGQVGTLVEHLASNVYEVDFSDDDGQTYAMLPLHTSQLLKLYYSANDVLPTSLAMENTVHQYGNGDNIAGDKVSGDKVMGDKVGNQGSNANIGNLVNTANDNAQITASGLTQTTGTSTAELLQIIAHLRQTAAQFPQAVQDDLIIDIDDVEEEIKKADDQRNWPRLKKRLTSLAMTTLAIAGSVAGGVAAANEFADEVIELGTKVGIELQLPPAP
ncbi:MULTISPECIES: DUF4926 domain-containing protein [Cyanophyceae]|uniref:DUF4926 domain-containing protein n=1 Tax=Cyanophyceae TaxID=3028117 RepID=UPI0016862734|nr:MULTISPECIES: DUF4926 domain-containing protein [Cyanophyceae]MBD1915775.1 DUF4926 domain-containing protein [Phormidium sp. FACHB-77]MBD2030038.1 DUF4926 domain-containing protein [Phormidium sp. FACHB-322]MBD2052150.1 DUF4926 domain-containing protein [Leptolyngbya sp. FACHB-60]